MTVVGVIVVGVIIVGVMVVALSSTAKVVVEVYSRGIQLSSPWQVPPCVLRLTALTKLDVYGNKLQEIPEKISELQQLQTLVPRLCWCWCLHPATVVPLLHLLSVICTSHSSTAPVLPMLLQCKCSPSLRNSNCIFWTKPVLPMLL